MIKNTSNSHMLPTQEIDGTSDQQSVITDDTPATTLTMEERQQQIQ